MGKGFVRKKSDGISVGFSTFLTRSFVVLAVEILYHFNCYGKMIQWGDDDHEY